MPPWGRRPRGLSQGLFDLAFSLRKLLDLGDHAGEEPAAPALRSEARAILGRLQDAVGPIWAGNHLPDLIKQLDPR